jgi:spore germination protein KA
LTVSQLTIKENWHEFVSAVLTGDTVILLNGSSKIFIGNTKKLQSRAVTEPTSQTVVRGPKDSFTENLRTNTSLIRARIQDSNLRLDSMKIGSVTQTDIGIMYIQGNADERIVEEIKERLKEIKVDGVLESNYIEEFIRDDRTTIFPLLLNTERPDAVVGNLLEGRIAIIVQGTPFVLIAPAIFSQFFQSPEDYYQNYYISSFLRILRFGSFFLSMYASAIYLALITHHQGLIPNTLMVSLMAQRERVPFPAIVEMIVMELAFEMLREAGIRMPRAIGPAVSIVGALILGQAAVEAGFVSAAVVIIVAISAISNFTLPSTSIVNAARGFRFILILISAFIGLYGILLMTLCIWLHISSLRSFGIPYFSPFAPFDFKEQKDTLVRFSLPSLLKKHQNK